MMEGWQAAVPALSTPEYQSLENWKRALAEQVPAYAEADLLIGHSLGGTFILRLLESDLIKRKQVILVSTLIDEINNEEYDSLNKSFIDTSFQWNKIKENCGKVFVFHGDDDPYVPMSQAETISKELDAPLQIIKGGGHINADSGYTEFPEILDVIDV